MYTKEQAVEIVNSFCDLVKDLKSELSIREAAVNECDKAFGDIRHFCELSYPTERKKRTQVCRLLKQYSDQRREAKDFIDVLTPLNDFFKSNPNVAQLLARANNLMKKEQAHTLGERKYAPRILNDLFKEE